MPDSEPQTRLHNALAELRRFRRKQLSAREPLAHQLCKGFVAATLLQSPAMMVPSIVYALVMNVTAVAVIAGARLSAMKKGGVAPAFSRK